MRRRLFLAGLAAACALHAESNIASIDFFGVKGIDIAAVRRALPVKPGDPVTPVLQDQLKQAVKGTLGREATDVAIVCCDTKQDRFVFIGLPGESSRAFTYNPRPIGSVAVDPEIGRLYQASEEALEAASSKGPEAMREDDSQGYALSADPEMRATEYAIRRYALKHEKQILRALAGSPDDREREAAAELLGYARQSPRQIDALVHASHDPSDGVRNNAVRALGVLTESGSKLTRRIPAAPFIDMLCSGIWTDRNKAGWLLMQLTKSRDPRLLDQLRHQALDALTEMARWQFSGYNLGARVMLGRIAGIDDSRLDRLLAAGDVETVISQAEAGKRQ